jgi:uncharacterized protein
MEGHETPPSGDEELRAETGVVEGDEGAVNDNGSKRNPTLGAARERRRKERHRAIALLPDIRYFDLKERVEIRTMNDAGEFRVEGSPIMYGAEYRVTDPWGTFVERIHLGSATDLLARGIDCRLLLNHDGLPMARTARGDHPGTMSVWDTDPSLRFGADLEARQQIANDFYYAVKRGDLDQMSVGMIVGRDKWGEESGEETRDIYALSDLLDVSGVTYPASPTTSIEVAYRMAMRAPVETYARVRRWTLGLKPGYALTGDDVSDFRALLSGVEDRDETRSTARAGKVLSGANTDKLLNAVGSLHDVLSGAGVDLSQIDPDQDGDVDTAAVEPDVDVSTDATTGGNDTAESGVGADGFPADQTRSSEPGEPIQYLAKAAIDQAWLDSLVERGEGLHGSARKRIA